MRVSTASGEGGDCVETRAFRKGSLVTLQGLTNDDFNWQIAEVAGFKHDLGRVELKFSDGKLRKVKPENVVVLTHGGGLVGHSSPTSPAAGVREEPLSYDAFLTHSWAPDETDRNNHERVSVVCQYLRARGFEPWFDEERMRGDINKTMSKALQKSRAVIVFLTKEYIEKASGDGPNGANDNCKFEFNESLLSKHLGVDKMIPVIMEPGLRSAQDWPAGTVRGKIGLKLYVDLSMDTSEWNDGLQNLVKELSEVTHKRPTPKSLNTESPKSAAGRGEAALRDGAEKSPSLSSTVTGTASNAPGSPQSAASPPRTPAREATNTEKPTRNDASEKKAVRNESSSNDATFKASFAPAPRRASGGSSGD